MADEVTPPNAAEESKTTVTTESTPATANSAEADVRGKIDALATEFGFDPNTFAEFTDYHAAQTAIRLAVEMGVNRPTQPATFQTNLPADRFSKPTAQSEPSAESFKPIDYKALGLDDDDAAAKALRLQEERLRANDARLAAMEARYQEQQKAMQAQAEQQILQQADEVISAYASPRYGTSSHRTRIQQQNVDHLLGTAAIIRQNSGGQLPLRACLNQARLLDEGAANAMNTVLPPKKPAASELPQGGAPVLGDGIKKMTMTEQWSQNPEFRARLGLEPRPQLV